MKRVLLVGGGTAGHVEPALAVGRWLTEHDSEVKVEFLGTRHGIETDLVPKAGFALHCISKVPLPRKVGLSLLTFPVRFLFSTIASLAIIRNFDLVIGFGGYVSASAYFAAWIARKPIVIHEANALPGWSNRLGARFATEIAVAFPSVKQSYPAWSGAVESGMPIRREIWDLGEVALQNQQSARKEQLLKLGLNPELPVILVFGGSQGSTLMNKAITEYARTVEAGKVQFIHAVGGKNSLPLATTNYLPISYIYNMAEMYLACDLIISRSGAVTCAEIEAVHKFAILVPLPIGNGEQLSNAQDLVKSEAAIICENSQFSVEWLKRNIPAALTRAADFNKSAKRRELRRADEIIGDIAISVMER